MNQILQLLDILIQVLIHLGSINLLHMLLAKLEDILIQTHVIGVTHGVARLVRVLQMELQAAKLILPVGALHLDLQEVHLLQILRQIA